MYAIFVYDWQQQFRGESTFITRFIEIITLRKLLMEGGKVIMDYKKTINQHSFSFRIRINTSLRSSSLRLAHMDVNIGFTSTLGNYGEL